MSFWDASDVVEWLRLQGVPSHGLAFAFRHGIDGETMDESVHLIVKDLQLNSQEVENTIIYKWRELADSGVEPNVFFGYALESSQPTEPQPVAGSDQAHTLTTGDLKNHPIETEHYVDDFEPEKTGESKSIPAKQKISEINTCSNPSATNPQDDESIPDETPCLLKQPSIADTVATDIRSVGKLTGHETRNQQSDQDVRISGQGITEPAKPPTVSAASTKVDWPVPGNTAPEVASGGSGAGSAYEAALRRQTELLRIQQERIRLQALMIERQRMQLQTLESSQNRPHPLYGGAPVMEVAPNRAMGYPTSPVTQPVHPAPTPRNYDGVHSGAAEWGPGTPVLPVLQDSISMLSVSDVFDTVSTDGNNQYAASATEMGALYESLAGTPRQSDPSGALWRSTPLATGGGVPVAHVMSHSHSPAADASTGAGARYQTANAGYTPARLRHATQAGVPGVDHGAAPWPSLGSIGPTGLQRQQQSSHAPAAAPVTEALAGVHTQASIDSAGLVWHRKRPAHRPKTAPKSSSAQTAVGVPKLDFAELPQHREAHRAGHVSDQQPGQANPSHQAQRPTTAPHSRRRPTFTQSSHAPLQASLTARRTVPVTTTAHGAALPPPVAAVQKAFDTARDAAIAQLLEWNRLQLEQKHPQHDEPHRWSADPARATASSARRDSERSRSPQVPHRDRPEKPPFGPNGALWQGQLRQYERTGSPPPPSPGRRRASSALTTGTGEAIMGQDGEKQKQRQRKGSRFERLIGKLAKQYGIDPSAPDTARCALAAADQHFTDTSDSASQRHRHLHHLNCAWPVPSWEAPDHHHHHQPHQRQRKVGEVCIMLECGSGTVRDGPSYLAPLKRPDEPPLYPHYSPRRPATSSRPGSRSSTRRGVT